MMDKKEYEQLVSAIKLEALSLGPLETLNTVCPRCLGGSSKEKSFSITREVEGILYHCFRDSCGIRGYISSSKMLYSEKRKKDFKPKILDRPLKPLHYNLLKWICIRYNIREDILKGHNWKFDYKTNRIAMPIYNFDRRRVGWSCKTLDKEVTPKVIHYWEVDSPKINVPLNRWPGRKCILVEDTLSSLSLLPYYNTIALLGTELAYEAARLIAREYPRIVIVLDADTWEGKKIPTGIKLRNKYFLMFGQIEVLRITADPKDMSYEQQVEEIFSKI